MKNVLTILFRRKHEAAIFAICMILFPLGISYMLTEKYESSAMVLLTAGRFKKPFLPNEKDSQTGFAQVTMEDMASEVELLTSRPVLEKVVNENELYIFPEPAEDEYLKRFVTMLQKGINGLMVAINLKKEMTDFEVAVEKLDSDIDVDFVKRSNIITIEWQGYTPEQARDVVDSIVRHYIKHHIEVHGYASAFKVIESEVQSDQRRVLAVENKISQLKADAGSYDLDKEHEVVLKKYLTTNNDQYKDRLNKLAKVRAQLAVLNRELAGVLESYQISRQKYNEALIAGAMDKADVGSVRMVAPASYTSTPAFPRKILLLVISIFFAMIGGIATAFASEKMYSRIVEIGDITECTKLPVLFTIPKFSRRDLGNEHWLTNSLAKRMTAIKHLLSGDAKQCKIHLIVSPSPGTGSSFLCHHLARYAARVTTNRVLYVDVSYQAEGGRVSIEDAASDMPSHIEHGADADHLSVCMSIQATSADSVSVSALIGILRENGLGYANIFIDLPNERDDASHLNIIPCCDSVYVNVAYDMTDQYALRRFISVIEEQTGVLPKGVFFNLRRNEIPEFIYRRL